MKMKVMMAMLFACVAICAQAGTTYTWTGGSGNWEDVANWSPNTGYPQNADDVAILPSGADSVDSIYVTVNARLAIGSLTVGGTGYGKMTLDFKTGLVTNSVSGAVTVKSGGTLTHFGPNTEMTHRLNLEAGSLTVESGGAINVDNKGYDDHCGPGKARCISCYSGESSQYWGWGSTNLYGSIREPLDYGSGANAELTQPGVVSGGGAMTLIVAGALTVNGTISSTAKDGMSIRGGTGGSILIRCGSLVGAGTGTITARGSVTSVGGSFGGGNGRIAVYQTSASGWTAFTGTITAAYYSSTIYSAGTVYLQDQDDTDGEGTLVIDNANRDVTYMTPLRPGVAGYDQPFGVVRVTNRGKLRLISGMTLKVTKGIEVTSNGSILTEANAAIEFIGDEDAHFIGGSLVTLKTLKCTVPGKAIRFGTAAADTITIAKDCSLILKGAAGNPLKLLRNGVSGTWPIAVNPNAALVDVEYVAVSNGNASAGVSVTAINSQDLGGNSYWGFSEPIVPNAPITWTGAVSTDWANCANWNPQRTPIGTDQITVNAVGTAKYPALSSGTYCFNKISVGSGASLTFGGGSVVTLTNTLTVAGALAFAGSETLYLTGDADFTGGTVSPGNSKIYATGTGDQTLDFGNTTLNKLNIEKPSGDISFGAHGFTAANLRCDSTARAITLTFAAGATYTINDLYLNGVYNDVKQITLKSSAPGTRWNLVATASGQSICGVTASDSDASAGATVYGGTKSTGSNTVNWDFVTDVASWIGGTGNFTDPVHWSSGAVPGTNTKVTVSAGDNETLVVTLPAATDLTVLSLALTAGEGGKATFAANSPLIVRQSVEIRQNGNLELNVFDDDGPAPNVVSNDVHIFSGGTLSHTGPNNTETRKLHLKVLGTLTVDEGGAVNVDLKGYTAAHGPGWVRCTPMYGATASGYCENGSLAGKYCYGCIRKPVNYGSAANGGSLDQGGGAIMLEVPGTMCLNGTVTSSGNASSGYPGAGGSVFIRCGTLSGKGAIRCRGAKSTGDGSCASSGGRIAVHQSTAANFTAFTGTMTTANNAISTSSCGTIYLQSAGDIDGEGKLIVDNAGKSVTWVTAFNTHMTDVDLPFGTVVVTNAGKLHISSGKTLKVTKGIVVSSNSAIQSDNGTVIEFVGTDTAVFTGGKNVAIKNLVCTNVAKRIYFGTTVNDVVTVPAGGNFTLGGRDGNTPLTLLPVNGSGTWSLNVNADALIDVKNVAVSNSNASAGSGILAIDSQDLGGNTLWSFSQAIVPGEVVTWTGAVSTEWADSGNWAIGRTPVETDDIRVNALAGESPKYPVLPSGNYSFNKISVGAGAALVLSGCNLTVTNKLTVAGSFTCSSSEYVYLVGDADFTGSSVASANSRVYVTGATEQTLDLGGRTFNRIIVDKSGGNVSFSGHGFTASLLRCDATNQIAIAFAAGETYSASEFYVNGVSGMSKLVTLRSSSAGTRWKLVTTAAGQSVSGLSVSDCDASGGAKIHAGSSCVNAGNNLNWDFASATAEWIGGTTGCFTNNENWTSGTAPGNDTRVMIRAMEGETVTVTVPANSPVSVGELTLVAGEGGVATLVANSGLTVSGSAEVRSGGVLTLNAYDDDGPAPNVVSNKLTVYSGGKLTHTGPSQTENCKVHLAVLGDMMIEANGAVDVMGKGYSATKGPGGTSGMCTGAAYAGYAYGNGKSPYGSIFCPTNWGSATCNSSAGGAIHLVVTGSLRVDGHVSADGAYTSDAYSHCGGSVWVECGTLTGSGGIYAREGWRTSWTDSDQTTSSGGRIAIYQRVGRDFTAFPKSRILTARQYGNSCGTVYLESADVSRGTDLYIDTLNRAVHQTVFPMAADGDNYAHRYENVNVTVGNGGKLKVLKNPTTGAAVTIRIRSLTLASATSYLNLDGNTLKIRDPDYRRMKDWNETAQGNVTLGGTVLKPGALVWETHGCFLFLK